MDTFPYESWDDALAAAAEGDAAYFTFGPGGSTGLVILTILGIALSLAVIFYITAGENKHLNDAAARLAPKYQGV